MEGEAAAVEAAVEEGVHYLASGRKSTVAAVVELLEGRMAFTPVHAVPVQFRTQAAHTVKPRRQLLRRRLDQAQQAIKQLQQRRRRC